MTSPFNWRDQPSQIVKQPKRAKPKPKPEQFHFSLSAKQREASILRYRYSGAYLKAHPTIIKGAANESDSD